MVGLSVVLEGHHHHKSGHVSKKANDSSSSPQVISKTSMSVVMAPIHSTKLSPRAGSSSSSLSRLPSFQAPAFLEKCFLCKVKLLPGKDIYMYKGDRAFCSEECRCRQIFMDEEETLRKENCSMAAIKPATASSPSSAPSPTSSRHRRAARNYRAGGFAY